MLIERKVEMRAALTILLSYVLGVLTGLFLARYASPVESYAQLTRAREGIMQLIRFLRLGMSLRMSLGLVWESHGIFPRQSVASTRGAMIASRNFYELWTKFES